MRLFAHTPLRDRQTTLVWAVSGALLLVIVCYPLGMLVAASLRDPGGQWTLANYRAMFVDRALRNAVGTSLKVAAGATVFSVVFGFVTAWGVVRTNMPLRHWVRTFVFLCFITPPYLGAVAWILLLGPEAGKLNVLLMRLFGLAAGPFNIFTLAGLIFVTFLYTYPFVFVACAATLENMDPHQEDAARMLGAGTWETALRVTAPLMAPAITGGAILAFIEALTLFGIPVMIGMPVGIHTITTRVYLMFRYPPQYELAAALCMPLLVTTAMLLIFQRLYLGGRSFTTVGGKASQAATIELGASRYLLVALAGLLVTASVILPYGVLGAVSLSKVWGRPLSPANLTLEHYRALFDTRSIGWRAFRNGFSLAAGAATISVVLTAVAATLVERTEVRAKSALTFLAMAPLAVPGVALGVAVLWAYISPPIALYGTIWILLVTYVTKWLPLGFMAARQSLKQIGVEAEEAARNLGATWIETFREVTLPLIKIGLLTAWLQVFIHAIRELPASALLYSPRNEVLSVLILTYFDEGQFESVAAVAIVLLVVVLGVVYLARRLSGRAAYG